ncbi:hypothetical protein [Undibacterium sp.]|uniref:hypothetical protein n=1 Tax=Undibacterium sp. TaxID=1914977 RepID=UPI00374DF459
MEVGRGWPGGHLLFLASPRKSKQKEGDRRLALRVMTLCVITFCCITKNGKQAKLAFGSNTPVSDPFSVTHKMLRPERIAGQRQRQRQRQMQDQIQLQKQIM